MGPYIISSENGVLRVGGTGDLSIYSTFDCGQCFRFDPVGDSVYATEYTGVARGRKIGFAQNEPGEIYIIGAGEEDFPVWCDYLALDVDYDRMNEEIIEGVPEGDDREVTRRAVAASRGIRILRQDRWEALCSFIISQNNNIPRIKKIIRALSEKYGEDIGGAYDFPSAASLDAAGEEEIFALRTGFRAKYIAAAAKAVSQDDTFLSRVASAETYEAAESLLVSLKGVGPKVAACTLLFGFERYDAFPVDVWIKKVLAKRYSEGFDYHVFGSSAGVAQQYLFYFERYLGGDDEK
ncbi:MAG: DNA-3-methyladenine glycosylase 2 family protein [Clostridia bacterium]|nr:DNA-3-methyladenine glycosylase 2 family protein [Clostridia bacterium]